MFLFQGDGPKLVRELFRVAEDHAPSIVFIDEIDAVGTKRYESNSGGEREIQRTMLELLNQLDGFDSRGDVKVNFLTPLMIKLFLEPRIQFTVCWDCEKKQPIYHRFFFFKIMDPFKGSSIGLNFQTCHEKVYFLFSDRSRIPYFRF